MGQIDLLRAIYLNYDIHSIFSLLHNCIVMFLFQNRSMIQQIHKFFLPILLCFCLIEANGQFIENFEGTMPEDGMKTPEGWGFATGDGQATMEFVQSDGYASIIVDASKDKGNIWWALVRVQIPELDIGQLMKPGYELRVEAKIRTSHAPRRVNLHFNHQRTTDFHSHLMEYDIPDTWNWHTISMTTNDFEVQDGDRINAQLALMDWGNGVYRIDIDYFKVDVVNRENSGEDLGEPLPYHPPLERPASFGYHLAVVQDAIIDGDFPDMNFNNWSADVGENTQLLATGGSQIILLRWDMDEYKGRKVSRSGLLELVTHSLQRSPDYQKDFGMVRIAEIIGGDPSWEQESVTYDQLRQRKPIQNVINTQMVIDSKVSQKKGTTTLFTISRPVLQRLIDGETLGLAVKPLGAVHAAFKSMENKGGQLAPRLHFDLE
jgi:hypothetical protein